MISGASGHAAKESSSMGKSKNAQFRYDHGMGGEVIYRYKYLFLAALHVLEKKKKSPPVLRRITVSVITETSCVWKPACRLPAGVASGSGCTKTTDCATGVFLPLSPARKKVETQFC